MLVQEIVEEIIEKLPENNVPVVSILRKVTQTRDRLMRNVSSSQAQSEVLNQAFDVTAGNGLFELICPPGNITEVVIRKSIYNNQPFMDDPSDWLRVPLKPFNDQERGPYYYLVAGQIGIFPPLITIPSMDLKCSILLLLVNLQWLILTKGVDLILTLICCWFMAYYVT